MNAKYIQKSLAVLCIHSEYDISIPSRYFYAAAIWRGDVWNY